MNIETLMRSTQVSSQFQEANHVFSHRTNYANASRAFLVFLSLAMLVFVQPTTFGAQPQGTQRKIVSDDFTKNRQKPTSADLRSKKSQGRSSANTSSTPKPPRTYRLASPPTKARPTRAGLVVAQLGITIWRLRPVRANETGTRMLVREKGKRSELVPERVEANTIFHEGDQLRLSIESPRTGYLYVVDRDLFSDGSTGPAMLIYPWANMVGGDNQMRPGKLVDIPAQEDDPSYFTANPTSPNQVGEILTVIVTTSPLDVPIADEPIEIPKGELAKWEKTWGGQSERFEMEGGAGEAWTEEEKQAGAKKNMRQLTRNDPAPQTIFRVWPADEKVLLVNVRLRYSK
jgi:uncharacterized protein DUF4384